MPSITKDLRIAGEPELPPIVHGQDASYLNTGYNRYFDLVRGRYMRSVDLTVQAGEEFLENGLSFTGVHFTSPVRVLGSDCTFTACRFTPDELTITGFPALHFVGENNRAEWCTSYGIYVTGPDPDDPENPAIDEVNGGSHTLFQIDGADSYVGRCHLYHGANLVTQQADDSIIEECYLHDPQNPVHADYALLHGVDGPHLDIIEAYAGSRLKIRKNKLTMHAEETACVNIAPYFGSVSQDEVDVEDNYFDGGNFHVIVDLQSAGFCRNVRVKRNLGAAHTNPNVVGRYAALRNSDGRVICETLAEQIADPEKIYWPTSGPDASYWVDCADLEGTSDTDATFFHGYYEDTYGVSTPGDLVPDLTGYAMQPDDPR